MEICKGTFSSCRLQPPPECEIEGEDGFDQCVKYFTIVIFPLLSLVLGVISQPLTRQYGLPYTLVLLLWGVVLGLLGCAFKLGLLGISLAQWVHLSPPTAFFYVFLAPLIFEASFNTRWHVFKRLLFPILTAAFIIVILQAGLIAAFQKIIVRYEEWSWWAALMYGAMLSATDPISVTATLKAVGGSEFLLTLIEGESLVNDGSAFVLWEAFFHNTKTTEIPLSIGEIVLSIFRLSIGGMLMGVAFGVAALIILGLVYDEFEVETSLTVIVAFLGFWTAQAPSRLSGVICNVASGLVISAFGRHLITPAVRGPLEEFWELLGWIANTVVFVHAGVLLSAFTWSCAGEPNTWVDYLLVGGYYIYLQIIRMGLIILFRPFMAIGNKWYQMREAIVVGFSGLRGAISLILALEVAGRDDIDEGIKSRVVLWTTGIVGLSLLINGILVKPLVKALKLDKAKKSREEFLHRARAVMVQRSLAILDSLCVETSFKAARWSYVVKNVLPEEWLDDSQHAAMYKGGLNMIIDNVNAHARRSLEVIRHDEYNMIAHGGAHNQRRSIDLHSLRAASREFTPKAGGYGRGVTPINRVTPRMVPTASPKRSIGEPGPLSIGKSALGAKPYSYEGQTMRLSIDADVARYGGWPEDARELSQAEIHREVQELHAKEMAGQKLELDERDREVQRRLLTAILSHVRTMSNASLVEFNVLHNLEEDVQLALDANDEGRDYNLFSFLDNRGRQKNRFFQRTYLRLVEGQRLRGETSITTAVVVFGVLTEILKEEITFSSPVVQLQAEHLYEGAASLLNRLEALNPLAFQWVQSQFAVYLTAKKQDEVLHDMLESGIVDEGEFKAVHHELIEVRRKHVRSRQSLFTRRASALPAQPSPRTLVKNHPLFSDLSPGQMSLVDRFGELVHLKAGQTVQAEKGALIVVLSGALRPIDDHLLHGEFATNIRKSTAEINAAAITHVQAPHHDDPSRSPTPSHRLSLSQAPGVTSLASGASMHWCFPAYSVLCGPSIALTAHKSRKNQLAIAHDRISDTIFCCSEVAGSATIFSLPVTQVRQLASNSTSFRMEITRALAREIVLESVGDQRPYALSHFVESVSTGLDENTVVGRAFRVLERLPYMTVLALEAGEGAGRCVQGPGVLLNGTVRVSIVDTSGLVGAINLLHEELTGPALLPAGGLIIEEVGDGGTGDGSEGGLRSDMAVEAADAAKTVLEIGERGRDVLAHVLIEVEEEEILVRKRLSRWTGEGQVLDMNGRFGMYRVVEMGGLKDMKVE